MEDVVRCEIEGGSDSLEHAVRGPDARRAIALSAQPQAAAARRGRERLQQPPRPALGPARAHQGRDPLPLGMPSSCDGVRRTSMCSTSRLPSSAASWWSEKEGTDHESFLSLFVQGRGPHGLSGPEEGLGEHELLFGLSAPSTGGLDARAGWTFRWDEEDDGEGRSVVRLVIHL